MSHPPVPHMSPDDFRELGRRMVDWVADYMQRVEDLPVTPDTTPDQVAASLPDHPPSQGLAGHDPAATPADAAEAWRPVFEDLESLILPHLTHWQSPRFHAYFPCNASGPAILGEILSAGLNVNGMLWATSPAATELETRVLDWMAELLDLPEAFRSSNPDGGGCIQGTASESTLVAMVAARRRARRLAPDPSPDQATPPHLVAYCSEEAHSSVVKAAMIAGLADHPEDDTHLRRIPVDRNHAMRPDALAEALRRDADAGRTPFYICVTCGTTSTCAIDPLPALAQAVADTLPPDRRPWIHIDAAYAGAAAICPEHRHILNGVEHAHSLCFNPHKWLLTNFDCDLFWTRRRRDLIDALSITPEYLRNDATDAGAVIDYRDWQIPLGRRFRALKLWFVLRHYGADGLRAYIREHCRLAERLEGWIRADDRFELTAPRSLGLVCFRLRAGDDPSRQLLRAVNASGRAFLTHTTLADPELQTAVQGSDQNSGPAPRRYTLRLALGSPGTTEDHLRQTWRLIQREADRLVPESSPGPTPHPT